MEVKMKRRAASIKRKPFYSIANVQSEKENVVNEPTPPSLIPFPCHKSPIRRTIKDNCAVASSNKGIKVESTQLFAKSTRQSSLITSPGDKTATDGRNSFSLQRNDFEFSELMSGKCRKVPLSFNQPPNALTQEVNNNISSNDQTTNNDVLQKISYHESIKEVYELENEPRTVAANEIKEETKSATNKTVGKKNPTTKIEATSESSLYFSRYLSPIAKNTNEEKPSKPETNSDPKHSPCPNVEEPLVDPSDTFDRRIYNFNQQIPLAFIAIENIDSNCTLVPVYRDSSNFNARNLIAQKQPNDRVDVLLPSKFSNLSMKEKKKNSFNINKTSSGTGNTSKRKTDPNKAKVPAKRATQSKKMKIDFNFQKATKDYDSENDFEHIPEESNLKSINDRRNKTKK